MNMHAQMPNLMSVKFKGRGDSLASFVEGRGLENIE